MTDYLNVDYDGLIPNNVDLNRDERVKQALEKWHPGYIDWWMDMGPEGFQQARSTSAPPSGSARAAGPSSTT